MIKNKRKCELLQEEVLKLNYGDIISHAEISTIINEPYGSQKYRSAIAQAKKMLLKNGKFIEPMNGKGYRVVDPDNYSVKSVTTFKQGFDRLKKATDILTYAPVSHMSDEGRTTYRNVSDRARSLYASMAGGCTELNLLTKKNSAYLPENIRRD